MKAYELNGKKYAVVKGKLVQLKEVVTKGKQQKVGTKSKVVHASNPQANYEYLKAIGYNLSNPVPATFTRKDGKVINVLNATLQEGDKSVPMIVSSFRLWRA